MRTCFVVALAALPCLLVGGGCHRVFECVSADNCISRGAQGVCQDTGFCSYPDPDCATGQRYDEFAGSGLAEQCVPAPDETGSSSGDDGEPTAGSVPCVVPDCVDGDGDGYGVGADCIGADCDDDNGAHHDRCVYVGPAGNDAGGEGTIDAPWGTIDRGVAALSPGMTLVLLDGAYEPATTGVLNVLCGDGGNAPNGTATQPISVRAANERAAEVIGGGAESAIRIAQCDSWRVHGLYARGGDLPAAEGGTQAEVVSISASSNIVLQRLLLSHNNRFYNTNLLSIAASTDVLVEEAEGYHYQGSAFLAWNDSARVTFRRCYANSRDHADLDGCDTSQDGAVPYCSPNPETGDAAFSIWKNAADVAFENCIADGRNGTGIGAPGRNMPNLAVRGTIITGDPGYGILIEACDADSTVPGTTIEDTLVTKSVWAGVRLRSTTDARASGLTLLNGGGVGLWADEDELALCAGLTGGCGVTVDRVLAQGNNAAGFSMGAEHSWSLESCNAFDNDPDWPAEEDIADADGSIRSSMSVDSGIGIGPGQCAVSAPADGPLSGAAADGTDIGATILFRIEGDVTDEPLWDPETGAFPCGAVVPGVNDDAATSCIGIHTRLNVFTEGCPAPPGYGAASGCE